MPIYIDLTSFMNVTFITGIQRVVWEVVIRLLKLHNNIILIAYDEEKGAFKKISNEKFINYYENQKGNKSEIITNQIMDIKEWKKGSIFFEIDSTWNNKVKRSYLLPILKKQGIKIVVHIYDIIPVLYPQYCHRDTIFRFLDYIGAHLQYADKIITNTNSTAEDLEEVAKQLEIKCPVTTVVPLGSDFEGNKEFKNIDKKAIDIVQKGKYILQVGTIEPRKNHKLVLDAFDEKIKDLGVNLVFVGRLGWNVEMLANRIKNHQELGKTFYHLEGCNNETVDYLYKNAFLSVFPTHYEGFGLPIIESIQREVPVISSDCKVLREVGGEYCDYFSVDNTQEIIKLVEHYSNNIEAYNSKKQFIKGYKSVTWEEVGSRIAGELEKECGENKYTPISPKQMVILSAQDTVLLETIEFFEKFMSFIMEAVILCPERIKNKIEKQYKGRLKIKFFTDEEVLKDIQLPKDHATRNFLLRCMAMKTDIIDDVFIMADDDYRPLMPISEEVFIEYGKYNAYYSYELSEWKGTTGEPTSYDISMVKAYEFLSSKGLPTKQYSAHMPQVIDKRIYLELLMKYEGIEYTSVDEWSTYFNYATYNYPEIFEIQPYKTMCWPALPTDWDIMIYPKEYLFENYYPHLYEKDNLFAGFSKVYHDDIIIENMKKIKIRDLLSQEYEANRTGAIAISKVYEYINKEDYQVEITMNDGKVQINLPKWFISAKNYCHKINVKLMNEENLFEDGELSYTFELENGIVLQKGESIGVLQDHNRHQNEIILPIWTPSKSGECILKLYYTNKSRGEKAEGVIPTLIYEK